VHQTGVAQRRYRAGHRRSPLGAQGQLRAGGRLAG
jgi:hypothetical protein